MIKYRWRTWDKDGMCTEWERKPVFCVPFGAWLARDGVISWREEVPSLDHKRGGPKAIKRIGAASRVLTHGIEEARG